MRRGLAACPPLTLARAIAASAAAAGSGAPSSEASNASLPGGGGVQRAAQTDWVETPPSARRPACLRGAASTLPRPAASPTRVATCVPPPSWRDTDLVAVITVGRVTATPHGNPPLVLLRTTAAGRQQLAVDWPEHLSGHLTPANHPTRPAVSVGRREDWFGGEGGKRRIFAPPRWGKGLAGVTRVAHVGQRWPPTVPLLLRPAGTPVSSRVPPSPWCV